jgi:filamentous hemagglutinin
VKLSRLNSSVRASGRARTIFLASLALAAFLAIATWSASARASGCANTFKNTAGGSWFTAANWSKEKVPAAGEEVCITEPGTYTVEMAQGPAVSLKTLTVGATSGTQTLAVESTGGANAVLTTSEGLAIGTHGAVTMTNNAADKDENGVTLIGPITNAGTLSSEKGNGSGGNRSIQGSLKNTGTLTIAKNTEYNSNEAVTLTNEGSIDLAEGATLRVSSKGKVLNTSGKIAATGSGNVLVTGSETSFSQGAATASGTLPVIVDDSALKYTGSGASLIAIRGTDTLAGSLSSGQSLQIQSTGGENAQVTITESISNGGTIALTNASDGDENNETLIVTKGDTLSNSGALASEKGNGSGGGRSIQGNVKNTGTFAVNKNTEYNGESATLTNEGTLEVANEKTLHVSNAGGVVNTTGGKILAAGSGVVLVQGSGTSFKQGAGTASGTLPVIVDDSALTYEGSGASLIAIRGTDTLAGSLSSGQSLQIQSTGGENAAVTVTESISNGGTISLTNASDGDENNETLIVTKGDTLSNSGTLASEKGNGSGGGRSVQGNVKNTGTFAVNKNTEYNGESATLTNEGSIDVAEGAELHVINEGGVVNATGGKILAGASGVVFVQGSGTSFKQGAGTTSGTLPVVVDDSALTYEGSGASLIAIRGTDTLAGSLSSGQSLQIQSTNGENAAVTAAASFTNAGTIALTNANDGDGNSETLIIAKGETLTNSGTLASEAGNGGGRSVQGNVTNTGTFAVNRTTEYNGSAANLLNEGKIVIATGVALNVSGGSTVVNATGGNIEATGSGDLFQRGGTFEEGAGKTTGTLPVVLDDLALKYTGDGASTIALRGASTLSGPLSAGQTLLLQSTNGENAGITAAGGLTDGGKLVLGNAADGDGNSVTLDLSGATLTVAKGGTLEVEHGNGGNRTLEGSVASEATIAASTTLRITGAFTESGKKPLLKITIAGASSFGALSASEAATITGELELVQVKPFVPSVGEKFVIVSSSKLTGTFTKVKKNKIKKAEAKLYAPVYSATSATLEAQA